MEQNNFDGIAVRFLHTRDLLPRENMRCKYVHTLYAVTPSSLVEHSTMTLRLFLSRRAHTSDEDTYTCFEMSHVELSTRIVRVCVPSHSSLPIVDTLQLFRLTKNSEEREEQACY